MMGHVGTPSAYPHPYPTAPPMMDYGMWGYNPNLGTPNSFGTPAPTPTPGMSMTAGVMPENLFENSPDTPEAPEA
jgi:hypothetical protein